MYENVPEFTDELHQNNVEPVFLSTGYGVGFFSREPLQSLHDLKNKRWRTASFWHRDFLNNFGSVPVTIPWGDQVYKAFAEKKLDGLMVNIDGGYQLKVYEQAPRLLTSKKLWLGHLYIVAMNKTTWNNLEQKDKEAIQKAAKKSYKKLGKIMDKSFTEQLAKLKAQGTKFRILSNRELKAFDQEIKVEQVQDNWVKEQETKGIKNLRQVIGKMRVDLKRCN